MHWCPTAWLPHKSSPAKTLNPPTILFLTCHLLIGWLTITYDVFEWVTLLVSLSPHLLSHLIYIYSPLSSFFSEHYPLYSPHWRRNTFSSRFIHACFVARYPIQLTPPPIYLRCKQDSPLQGAGRNGGGVRELRATPFVSEKCFSFSFFIFVLKGSVLL